MLQKVRPSYHVLTAINWRFKRPLACRYREAIFRRSTLAALEQLDHCLRRLQRLVEADRRYLINLAVVGQMLDRCDAGSDRCLLADCTVTVSVLRSDST